MTNNTILNFSQALQLMTIFLREIYTKNKSDDLGGLLGDITVLKDGQTRDPAAEDDWLESIEKVINTRTTNRNSINLDLEQVFKTMIVFLEGYYNRTESTDIASLLYDLKLTCKQDLKNTKIFNEWLLCSNKINLNKNTST